MVIGNDMKDILGAPIGQCHYEILTTLWHTQLSRNLFMLGSCCSSPYEFRALLSKYGN